LESRSWGKRIGAAARDQPATQTQAERVHMQGVLLAIDSMGEKISMVRNTSLRLKQHTGSHWKPQMASKVVALKTVSTL